MQKFLIFILSILLLLTMFSCSNDDESSTKPTMNELNTTLQGGEWKIVYFLDRDEEKTNYFTGYVFQFNANGKLTAKNTATKIEGTWSSRNDSGKTKLDINFSTPEQFEEISEDWEIITKTDTQIELLHVSGGDGHKDYLTFKKL